MGKWSAHFGLVLLSFFVSHTNSGVIRDSTQIACEFSCVNPLQPDAVLCIPKQDICDGECDCAPGCSDEVGCALSSSEILVKNFPSVKSFVSTNNATNSTGNYLTRQLTKFKTIVSVVVILVGLVECFAGAKLYQATLFCAGFAGGFYIMLLFFHLIRNLKGVHISTDAELGVQLGFGTLAGLLTLKVVKLGVFTAGALGGVLLALFLRGLIVGVFGASQTIFIVVVVVFLLIGAFLGFKFFNLILIPATALLGSFGFFLGIDIVSKTNMLTFTNIIHLHFSNKAAGWGFVSGWIVLFVIGCLVQIRLLRGKPRSRAFSPKKSRALAASAS